MQLVNWRVTKRPPLTPKSRLICILPNKRQLGLKTKGLMLKIDAVEKNLEGHLSGHGRLERVPHVKGAHDAVVDGSESM